LRLLILGGSGMLGHQLWRSLCTRHEVWVTLRLPVAEFSAHQLFTPAKSIQVHDITDDKTVGQALGQVKPDAVINCVGLIKQHDSASDDGLMRCVNADFPHRLAKRCAEFGVRLIHFSTDCVFAGIKGKYTEDDLADATDLYGQTKHQGEVTEPHCMTLRSSVIGPEISSSLALLNWFLSQRGETIRGFTRAIYSGFTTIEMARIVERILTDHPSLSGIWQVASEPISKYDLLKLFQTKLDWEGTIEPDDAFVCDRSLDGSRFNQLTGYQPPSWEAMITELAKTL
jgi:dTDP-4-dehydrorhamnose reductase